MESKVMSGTSLIIDRYSYSGVAFSAAKGLDVEWCKVSFHETKDLDIQTLNQLTLQYCILSM